MFCPLRFISMDGYTCADDYECTKEDCAWWSERFGMCCQAVNAYLQGLEDLRRERDTSRRGG